MCPRPFPRALPCAHPGPHRATAMTCHRAHPEPPRATTTMRPRPFPHATMAPLRALPRPSPWATSRDDDDALSPCPLPCPSSSPRGTTSTYSAALTYFIVGSIYRTTIHVLVLQIYAFILYTA
ncbi:hypothetical protein OG21DRAFT_949610 [Imleria badia]|nr:hypothetical protein OG21DRAFT_949610 [Imleria badia]